MTDYSAKGLEEPDEKYAAAPMYDADVLPDMTPLAVEGLSTPEERKALGEELSQNAADWLDYVSALYPRWLENEKLAVNQVTAPTDLPWDGAVYRHIPVTSTKLNGWHSFVCQPPTSATPYLVGTIYGRNANRAKDVEQDFYFLFRKGDWSDYFRLITYETGLYGVGFWRVSFARDEDDLPYFKFDDIDVRSWLMYPNVTEMKDAEMIGHLYELSVREIEAMQSRGEMYGDWKPQGTTERKEQVDTGKLPVTQTIAKGKSLPVRCAEVFIKRQYGSDPKPKWYIARFAVDTGDLLGVYNYPYTEPWYIEQRVHREPRRFMPETSRANDLQPIQQATNDTFNQTMWGFQMAWDGPVFGFGLMLDKYKKLKPGSINQMNQAGSFNQVKSQAQVGEGLAMMSELSREADRSIRFGDQQLGAEVSPQTKATVADIQQRSAGFAAADDLAKIDVAMGRLGRFCQQLYRAHYMDFYEAYGEDLAVQPDEQTQITGYPSILKRSIQWEIMGKSPANSPVAQTQSSVQLADTLSKVTAPPVLMGLSAIGFNIGEFVLSLVKNSNLNDRDTLLTGGPSGIDQYVQELRQQQAAASAPKQESQPQVDPMKAQMDQAKMQIEAQKLGIEQQRVQIEQERLRLDADEARINALAKIYPVAPTDVQREIEPDLGVAPSRMHPVLVSGLQSHSISESIFNPKPPPATNGKAKGVMK